MHRAFLIAVSLALVLPIPSSAQVDERAVLHAEQNTLWAHKSADAYFMSAIKEDPDGTVASAGYNALGYVVGTPGELTFTFPFRPVLANDVTLGDEDVVITFYVGGCIGPEGGAAFASTELMAGGTAVATGADSQIVFAPSVASVTWRVPPQVDAIAAGTELVWTVHLEGVSAQACGRYSGSTHSSIVLPLTNPAPGGATAPATHFDDLATPALDHNFTNATSDTYVLNFTTALVNSTAGFSWNATAGNVSATLRDGNGTVVFNGTFTGNGTLDHAIANATAGTWNLTLGYAGFNGTFGFELKEPVSADSGPIDGGDAESDPTPDGNGTATLDSAPKDTPLPLVAPLLGVAAAVGVRRRR